MFFSCLIFIVVLVKKLERAPNNTVLFVIRLFISDISEKCLHSLTPILLIKVNRQRTSQVYQSIFSMRYTDRTILLALLSLLLMCPLSYSYGLFSKNTTIAYSETGLFLDYVGLYTPSETIIHNSAIFPMTTATCHFLPLSAAQSIPSCNITIKRHKRLVTDLVSIGMGVISIGMSTANTIQISNLQGQVAVVEKALTEYSQAMQIHGAQLAKIHSNQIELAEELHATQQTLDAMIPILNSHSEALKVSELV